MKYVLDPNEVEYWSLDKYSGGFHQAACGWPEFDRALHYTSWAAGALAPEHTRPHEQMGLCLQGKAVFTIAGVDYVVKSGQFYQIPGSVPHAERNDGSEPAVLIDFFSPIREDLLRRTFEAYTLR